MNNFINIIKTYKIKISIIFILLIGITTTAILIYQDIITIQEDNDDNKAESADEQKDINAAENYAYYYKESESDKYDYKKINLETLEETQIKTFDFAPYSINKDGTRYVERKFKNGVSYTSYNPEYFTEPVEFRIIDVNTPSETIKVDKEFSSTCRFYGWSNTGKYLTIACSTYVIGGIYIINSSTGKVVAETGAFMGETFFDEKDEYFYYITEYYKDSLPKDMINRPWSSGNPSIIGLINLNTSESEILLEPSASEDYIPFTSNYFRIENNTLFFQKRTDKSKNVSYPWENYEYTYWQMNLNTKNIAQTNQSSVAHFLELKEDFQNINTVDNYTIGFDYYNKSKGFTIIDSNSLEVKKKIEGTLLFVD